LEEVVKPAAKEAAQVAVWEIHAITEKEAVVKEAAAAALHEIHHDMAMATFESVLQEAATIAV
jgi:hypothetical protein